MRHIALLEAISFLALLAASVVKRTGGGEVGVEILGPIHGGLFLCYLIVALTLRDELGWRTGTTLWVVAGAVIPFGGFVVDRWLARQEAAPA